MSTRRGGIPGPESRTGLTRPVMSEAEFERRLNNSTPTVNPQTVTTESHDSGVSLPLNGSVDSDLTVSTRPITPSSSTRTRSTSRVKASKPRRVQRMFALEEDLDKKLWLYAIHLGKDRSEVINDLLRPVVASMVLYDSRDRRSTSNRSVDNDLVDNRENIDMN